MGECLMTRPPDQINTMPYFVHKTSLDFNSDTAKVHGIHIIAATPTNAPCSNWGTLFVDALCGTPYQLYIPDGVNTTLYKRSSSGTTWYTIGGVSASIETGSYSGTGGDSISLTFSKTPYIVVIQGNNLSSTATCVYGSSRVTYAGAMYENDEWGTGFAALSWSTNSIVISKGSFSPHSSFAGYLNSSGKTYCYTAIVV